MGVVLGEGADPQQPVQNALALVARDPAELGEAQRQLPVGVAARAEDEAGARAVHRPQGEAALVGFHEVHVVAVVLPVPGAVPELLVEDLRRGDLLVAAAAKLFADLGLDQPQQHGAVGQPEGHPGRFGAQHEDPQLRPQPPVVAGLRLLDPLQVGLEVGLGEEGGAVDPGQHPAALVTSPVGAGERIQLQRLDPPGRGTMRAPAEVLEGPVAIQRDRLDALVADQVLDQLDLVVLVLPAEQLDRLAGRQLAPLEGLVRGDVGAHRLLDPGPGPPPPGRSRRGTRSRSRSHRRSAGRSSPGSPGKSSSTASAITWAASWRISSRASGSRSVRIEISSPSRRPKERSRSSPSARTASAALARPGPIASAASAPVAPSGSSRDVPSGSFTVISAIAPMLTTPPNPTWDLSTALLAVQKPHVAGAQSRAGPWRAWRTATSGQLLAPRTGPARSQRM